jgi:hypothetical protein
MRRCNAALLVRLHPFSVVLSDAQGSNSNFKEIRGLQSLTHRGILVPIIQSSSLGLASLIVGEKILDSERLSSI